MSTYFINTIDNLWEMFFGNTGNIIWHDKCKIGIDFDHSINLDNVYDFDFKADDVLCVPVANNLSLSETYFSKRLRKLHGINAKIVLFGLGVQASLKVEEDLDSFVKNISGSKKRLFRMLSEKCTSIGARGEITRQCLYKMGIKNVRVIGCPSFYSNLIYTQKDEKISINNKIKKVLLNYSGNAEEIEQLKNLLGEFPECKMHLIRQGGNDLLEEEKIESVIFNDVDLWDKYIYNADFDLSVGTRLHGNMIAYLNGVPTLWIARDARVKEVCDALKLPYLLPNDLEDVDKFENYICSDFYNDNFYLHRKKMRREYIQFLEENNVKHKFDGDNVNE